MILKKPTRAVILPSSPYTIAAHRLQFFGLSFGLFLLPALVTLAAFASRNVVRDLFLRLLSTSSPTHVSIGLSLISLYYSFFFLLIGASIFPSLNYYHRLPLLFIPLCRRRHHFSFMTPRRLRQLGKRTTYTIFIRGPFRRTIPLVVNNDMSIDDVERALRSKGLLPNRSSSHFFTFGSRFKPLDTAESLGSLGLRPLSQLNLILPVLGGSKGNETNLRRSFRPRDTTVLRSAIAEELRDEEGNLLPQPTISRRRYIPKSQTLATSTSAMGPSNLSAGGSSTDPVVLDVSDPEDDDYSDGYDSEDNSSEEASEGEPVSNTEMADNLQSKTTALRTRKRKGNEKTAAVKKRRRVVRREDPILPTSITAPSEPTDALPGSTLDERKCSRRNPIYLFFEEITPKPEELEDQKVDPNAKYFKCWLGTRKILRITKTMKGSLTGLKDHIRTKFPVYYKMFEALQKRSDPPTDDEISIAGGRMILDAQRSREYGNFLSRDGNIRDMLNQRLQRQKEAEWDQEKFETLLAKWIASCDQPFSAVEEPEFQELLRYVHLYSPASLHLPGRKAVRSCIIKMGEDMRNSLKTLFKANKSDFSVSLDAWTSSNGYAFMAIVLHWVGEDGQLEECLIDFRELIGEHSGENMAHAVWETLESYGLLGRIIAFVMDNASNNDTMVESFERLCLDADIAFSAMDSRMRCMPHTIHLACLKLLEAIGAVEKDKKQCGAYQDDVNASVNSDYAETLVNLNDGEDDEANTIPTGIVAKLRRIVRNVRSSPQRRKSWLETVANVYKRAVGTFTGAMLILDVKTHWSSTHQMLERSLLHRQAIDNYTAVNRDLRDTAELSSNDWESLKLAATWLNAFRSATTQMSATKHSVLSTTHTIFRGLQDHLKAQLRALPWDADEVLRTGLLKAHEKLSDYFTKFDRSPFYTWASLLDPRISYQSLRDDYKNEPALLADLEIHKINLYERYQSKYTIHHTDLPEAGAPGSEQPRQIDFTARYLRENNSLRNELDEYFKITAIPEPFTVDPIDWWYAQRNKFPTLYLLVRDVFSIPGSAVAVERIFSGGRDTITLRRASLKPQTIQTLMLVKAQLRVERAVVNAELGKVCQLSE